ncbi:ABC transporter permease [Glaciibacter psychrotolerans]|uniref:Simple sugar transport system permease protein n=1 Tax=Glaciibacter psychrotolerans TaxID=670054 RepID=A0A7Z0EFN3_9MICO|nr:ABC transporter permease [Leifsonia psychrotolerans]NYJ20786.1 simple sugar transport system permease protein [Leifsonia psychrotolerans]
MDWSSLIDAALIESVVRAMIPILLAALAGLICERAGIFNIALEGLMLVGAFGAVAGSFFAGNALVGVIVAILVSMAFSMILSFGTITRKADPIVLGVAMNILAVGVTSFLMVAFFHVQGVFQSPDIKGLPTYPIPFLSEIPWIGPAVFNLTLLGYLALILVPVISVVLFRSPLGMRLRGVGERPLAAKTLGISPTRYQYGAVLVAGALTGLAGAQLALGNVVQFAENMSAGRGWIAVVAVMLARANPWATLGACVLFGFAEAIGFRLQGNGFPAQITDAAPYVVTLIALLFASRSFRKRGQALAS